ncbi:hypothetical protein [Paraburkholderia sp.]|uniref:hypothetical protein n=1 Tax=Paraburkholderia sp. TaxID=1926495 RepID=UPI002AFFB224|nr:hypothetical protein [Paraburkholderia sp.]
MKDKQSLPSWEVLFFAAPVFTLDDGFGLGLGLGLGIGIGIGIGIRIVFVSDSQVKLFEPSLARRPPAARIP